MNNIKIIITFFMILTISFIPNTSGLIKNSSEYSKIIYVDDDNINGPWDGTKKNPYCNIQDAVDIAQRGNKIYVFNGVYNFIKDDESKSIISIFNKNKLTIIGEDKNSTIIEHNSNKFYTIYIKDSNEIIIEGFTIFSSFYDGIFIRKSNDCEISGNIFDSENLECRTGIFVVDCKNIEISKNIIKNHIDGEGIYYFSVENLVINLNKFINNGCGVRAGFKNNKIINNNFESNDIGLDLNEGETEVLKNKFVNNNIGINISSGNYNIIKENEIFSNKKFGIIIKIFSDGNQIFNNEIENNKIGIKCEDHTKYNMIYNNNFIKNNINAIDNRNSPYYKNYWNYTYEKGGNYWDDLEGVDIFKGENQNIPGKDNIFDDPYKISGDNSIFSTEDNYPLTEPFEKNKCSIKKFSFFRNILIRLENFFESIKTFKAFF